MPAALRYRHPDIIQHLASQYAVMQLSPRVRARTDRLRQHIPALDQAIVQWTEHFAELQWQLPEKIARSGSWEAIAAQLSQPGETRPQTRTGWWQSLLLWRSVALATSLASLILITSLVLQLYRTDSEQIVTTPSYVAVLSAHAAATATPIEFVVNLYPKNGQRPSRLFIQWSVQEPRQHTEPMHLWARDRDSGAVSYIGSEPPPLVPWDLDKRRWLQLANSSELIFTRNAESPTVLNTLFTGPCIQLGPWRNNSS